MTEHIRNNADEFVIVTVPPRGSSYQTPVYRRLKIMQESEKNSWLGIDIQSVGKVGTKGVFQTPMLLAINKKAIRYLHENHTEDSRPPLITFTAVNEEQLSKEAAPLNIYSKGCLYQQKDLLYRIYKTDARLVRSILENAGFNSTDSHDWNIIWVGSSAQSYLYEGLNEYQKINHFPNSFEITRKDKLHLNIDSMIKTYGREEFDFTPETFLLPDQYNEFYVQFHKNKYSMWIHKPCGSSQGKGIFLINSPSDIPLNEPCIVSRYIQNPLLINDLKFDIRIYVLVTSFDPLRIYIYDEGLARFACETYNPNNKANRFCHLTNYSVNKKNDKFIQNQDWKQDNIGHKWSLAALNKTLEGMGVDTTLLWAKIYDIIIKSILSIEPLVLESLRNLAVHRNNCFDLFGFDILIDSELKPWLLEVNLSPSLATDSPLDLHIKSNLIADTFNLIGIRGFDRKKESVNKVRARIKARQIKLARERKKLGDSTLSFSDDKQGRYNEIFKETLEEYERRGQFMRIYPAKGCEHYDRFFSGLRHNNKALFKFLYYDLWELDVNNPTTTIRKEATKAKSIAPIITEEKLSLNFEDFIMEYSSRLAHALKTLPEEGLKQEWKVNIENFANHSYWPVSLKQYLLLWQQLEERVNELKRNYFDEKKVNILKSLSAIKLEVLLKSTSKNQQIDLINCFFIDSKTCILTDIIKWLSQKAKKHTSYISRRKTRDEDTSIDGSG